MAEEKERTFRCGDIPKKAFSIFQEMQNRNEFCDIIFQLGSESFSAHRIIIAAVMPQFRSLQQNKEDIGIQQVDPNAFKQLLEFAYRYEIKIDTENVKGLLSAACYLGVSEVQKVCCEFIADILEHENVVSMRLFAEDLNCSELLDSTDCYIKENFSTVSQTKDFTKLPLAYLKELIDEDDINISNEKEVLSAVMKWTNECPEDRCSALPELLLKIRMHLIEPLYLTDIVKTERVIQKSIQCRDLLDEAKNYNLFPQLRSRGCSFRTKPRQSLSSEDSSEEDNRCIYLLNSKTDLSVQRCDPQEGKWSNEKSVQVTCISGSSAQVGNEICFFDMGRTLKYESLNNSYKYASSKMPTFRYLAGATSFQNKIYVCGGRKGDSASDAVECFDPEQDKWEIKSSMPKACWGLSAVTLGKHIYILGGKNECFVYDHMHRYDPVKQKWKTMPSMLSKRSYAGAAVLKGKIYVCGGATDVLLIARTPTAEAYDPFKNTWEYISPMNCLPHEISLLSCRGKLYTLGREVKEGKYIDFSEIYEPEKDKWSSGIAKDPTFRISGAVVM